MKIAKWYPLGGIFVIFIFDRITKSWALGLLNQKNINPFLSFDLAFNRGINWGLFHSDKTITFAILNSIIVLIIGMLVYKIIKSLQRGKLDLGYTLIAAGAFSNLWDRLMYGGVIDFIILQWSRWSWPAFNIADAMIITGIGLVMIDLYKNK